MLAMTLDDYATSTEEHQETRGVEAHPGCRNGVRKVLWESSIAHRFIDRLAGCGKTRLEKIIRRSLLLTIGVAGMSSLGTELTGERKNRCRMETTELMNAVPKQESGSRNEAMR
jgi:hypothetical protein